MIVQPINTNSPTFGYSHQLKTLYKKGQLPVRYGFYGDRLTIKNVSLEHIKTRVSGGKTELANLVLASKEKNNARGDKPLSEFINLKAMAKYLDQFRNIYVKGFDGNTYIKQVLQTIGDEL